MNRTKNNHIRTRERQCATFVLRDLFYYYFFLKIKFVFKVSWARQRVWATNAWFQVGACIMYMYNNNNNININVLLLLLSLLFMNVVNRFRNHTATTIMQSMNTAVDPCDNFFEFACGNWQNQYHSEPGQANSWFIERTRYISMVITSKYNNYWAIIAMITLNIYICNIYWICIVITRI